MLAIVSALSSSSIGIRRPASADDAKALSFRMSGRSLAWMRDCTVVAKSSQPAICSSTLTFGCSSLNLAVMRSQSASEVEPFAARLAVAQVLAAPTVGMDGYPKVRTINEGLAVWARGQSPPATTVGSVNTSSSASRAPPRAVEMSPNSEVASTIALPSSSRRSASAACTGGRMNSPKNA